MGAGRHRLAVIVGLALVGAGLLLASLREPERSDEQVLGELVGDVAEAAGRRDVGSILEHVSANFRGGSRSIETRDDLRRLLLGVLMRSAWSRVVVLERRFDVRGDEASGTVRFVGVRGGNAPATLAQLGPGMDAYEVTARLSREDGTWRVVEATYQPLRPGIR